jgi:Holliday junction resolvase RusA-like endonuclease
MRTEFFMAMIPPTVTHQEKNVKVIKNQKGKMVPLLYEPQELKAARVKLQDHLGKYVPAEKYTGAVQLITKWCFPVTGKHLNGQYKTTKPDTDNLQKMLKDVMTKLGYWTDDALVASEITEKFWADRPGIYIVIEDLK